VILALYPLAYRGFQPSSLDWDRKISDEKESERDDDIDGIDS